VSRLGNKPIAVPQGVDITISPEMKVTAKGPKGQLEVPTEQRVSVTLDDSAIMVSRPDDSKESRAFHGLYQRLIENIVIGVTQGFRKELEIQGVGYRVAQDGKGLTLSLGFSHPVQVAAPEGIVFEVPDQSKINILGCDKQLVGQVAANIRRLRPPEPYKGKGIRYVGEYVRRKVGKTGAV
jgi:large subunit ribosomal protein L6